ncbi:MAG TPA: phosphopantothenoylcysteine decarboxylase domain-containing protein [Candidatus Wunengus sp. YC60]|uniref:phosphopantothenoylcysteine decarboxylase domain-containing protein n=1 Tax=Candidatus Wunengus sp. YC60 TaxID=3367697 RepID=UPI004025D3AB
MGSLEGKSILITSGPTRGYIDAVRYISNKSTGKLGVTIATEALKRDACVTFIYGTGSSTPDVPSLGKDCARRLTLIEIETINDLMMAIQEKLKGKAFDAIVHAMAVLDYSPEKQSEGKIASNKDTLTITLRRTPKVIKQIRALWPHAFLIGFKLEVGLSKNELIERAYASMIESRADLVVANNQNEIAGDKHRAYLINSHKEVESGCETRQDIASNLMDLIGQQNA